MKLLPLAAGFVFVAAVPDTAAQEQAGAVQKSAAPQKSAAVAAPSPSAPVTVSPAFPAGVTAPAAPPGSGELVPLRNVDLLNRMDEDRLPTRPRRHLKLRFSQVRRAKDEKILQLLLISVGFVGAFIAILALRSIPSSRPASKQ